MKIPNAPRKRKRPENDENDETLVIAPPKKKLKFEDIREKKLEKIVNKKLDFDDKEEEKSESNSGVYKNVCLGCGVDMGDCNARQYCRKTYCPEEDFRLNMIEEDRLNMIEEDLVKFLKKNSK